MTSSVRLRALAAALTLLSGGIMMLSGYIAHEHGWGAAGFITVPAGVLILAALASAERSDQLRDRGVAAQVAAMGITMLSGAVMVAAGYRAAADAWVAAFLFAILGGLVILGAFALRR